MEEKTLRSHGKDIIAAALAAAAPEKALMANLLITGNCLWVKGREYDLANYNKICVIGGGKAGAGMARGLEKLLGRRINSGLVTVKDDHVAETEIIKIREAGHPVPDTRSVAACQELISYIQENNQTDTLFISLLSGGASSLLAAPISPLSLADKKTITRLLLECGADIHEINTVRKHLSRIKGGQMAMLTYPAQVINLIISDVIGDDLEIIGSGPFCGDSGTWEDSFKVLTKYDLLTQIPDPVRQIISQGQQGLINDTPSPGKKYFAKVDNHIIASNTLALQAAATEATAKGYTPYILPNPIAGDTTAAAQKHLEIIKGVLEEQDPVSTPCCLISGGETTVSLGSSHGRGGRNQEFALATVNGLKGLNNIILFSLGTDGTDGTDGPTTAAGALVTGSTLKRAKKMNLDPSLFLNNHNSYEFFKPLGDLLITGPTMTNVMDIHIILINSPPKN